MEENSQHSNYSRKDIDDICQSYLKFLRKIMNNTSIQKITIADKPVYILDVNTAEGRLIQELVNKLRNGEDIGISEK
jgi:hypothetical protein